MAGDGQVTALELFFDPVFVFGFTQVTGYLATNLTWPGMARGAALFAALWWPRRSHSCPSPSPHASPPSGP